MTLANPSNSPTTADLDAARLLLGRLGISPAEFLSVAADRAPAPTFAEYVPVVRAAVGAGTRRVYGSYWNRIVKHWGARRLDEPTPSEIQQLAEHIKTHVVARRNARGGRGAAEHFIAALRCLYRHAENDGHVSAGDNPARKVAKPRRFNRTFFFAAIEREIARSARSGRGFCLLMMDLDELKAINDRFGHFMGDRVLRGVGDVIRDGVRKIDISARYGGDEFVVLLPETDPTGAYVLAEKIRIGVAELNLVGTDARTSLSVGVVSYPDDGKNPDELMISADRAMYASKRGGKNRVMGLPVVSAGRSRESV